MQFPDPDYNPDEKITVATFDDLADLMEAGSVLTIGLPDGKRYHYLPFWFESVGGSWIIHHENDLPDDLKRYRTEGIYDKLADHLGLKETPVNNLWLDEEHNEYILGRLGFKRKI